MESPITRPGWKRIYRDTHDGVNLPTVQSIENNRMRIVTLTDDGEEDVEEARGLESP